MAQAFFGGVHPNDMKAATNEKAIEQLAAPAEVVIPMSMHIGAPCKPIVAVGDKVKIGQRIGEPGGFVSAPIHASISGTVKAVEPRPFSMGGKMMSVVIENDFQDEVSEEVKPVADPDSLTPGAAGGDRQERRHRRPGRRNVPHPREDHLPVWARWTTSSSTPRSASRTSPATTAPVWSVRSRSSRARPCWPSASAWIRCTSASRQTSRTRLTCSTPRSRS